MKKVVKDSGSSRGFKPVLSKKKRKDVTLEEGIGKRVSSKVLSGHSWGFETGNTTEFESIDMEEECLIEKTSFDYSKTSLEQTTEKTRATDILVNTDLKKSTICSNWAVMVKKILVEILAKAVHPVLSEFGSVMSIKMQLTSMLIISGTSLALWVEKHMLLINTLLHMPDPGVHIVMGESSDVVTGGKAIAEVGVFNPISKMKETLNNLSITVMDFLAKIDNAGLVSQEDVVCWHFDGVRIFSSDLDKEFFGAGVAIIINDSLTCYVFKVKEISGHLISVWFFFKGKLLIVILGLYANAFAKTRFSQACKINSFIVKAVNFSIFVILSGDFNENRSRKSANFKFCLDLELVNSFSDTKKIIDYIFVSKNLLSALASHKVVSVSDFFDTDHNVALVSVSLDGLLNTRLNNAHLQTNKDKWKFKIKDVDAN
ncbi:hypothetical protein G9A89_003899, partial [Geosiphon pyriformis]